MFLGKGSGQQLLGMAYAVDHSCNCSISGSCLPLLRFPHFPKPILYALTPILPHFSWTMQCFLLHPPIFICSPFSFQPPNPGPHSTPEFPGEHYPSFNTLRCSVIIHSWVFFDYLLPELNQCISHSILCVPWYIFPLLCLSWYNATTYLMSVSSTGI